VFQPLLILHNFHPFRITGFSFNLEGFVDDTFFIPAGLSSLEKINSPPPPPPPPFGRGHDWVSAPLSDVPFFRSSCLDDPGPLRCPSNKFRPHSLDAPVCFRIRTTVPGFLGLAGKSLFVTIGYSFSFPFFFFPPLLWKFIWTSFPFGVVTCHSVLAPHPT